MIKLVVCDLDDTLLPNGEKNIKPEVFEMIKELREKGIYFAAASGRCYTSLRKLFLPVAYDIFFICENGALIIWKNEILYQESILPESAGVCIAAAEEKNRNNWLGAGIRTRYIASADQEYLSFLKEEKISVTRMRECRDIPERLLRISLWNEEAEKLSEEEWVKNLRKKLKISYIGKKWMDFQAPDTDKGKAVGEIRKHFLTAEDKVLAFGDGENDRNMLKEAEYAYCMAHGNREKLAFVKNITEDAVETINKLLL